MAEESFRLREHCHLLRRLEKELVGRMRSLRYFEAVRTVQGCEVEQKLPVCVACGKSMDASNLSSWAIMSCCGHQGCASCVMAAASNQECLADGCGAAARVTSVIDAASLVANSTVMNAAASRYGTKLGNIVRCIESLPKDDRILIFVQFSDLAKAVAASITESGIRVAKIEGSVIQKTKVMDSMQEVGGPRVLL